VATRCADVRGDNTLEVAASSCRWSPVERAKGGERAVAVPDERPINRPRHVRSADEPGSEFGAGFDRQPPQDLAAEQSVLGGMLLSKDAIADVVEILRPDDFYRPAHQTVFECILDLYGRGEPADPVTVSAELERRGDLVRLGGAPYLHTLIATVPTAANAAYYAEIVSEKAILRRLVEAGTRIVQLGYLGAAGVNGADVDDVVDRAQAAIYDVTERRTSEDYVPLEELLQPTMDEIDAIASRGGVSFGVPTGFGDLDAVTNGLHAGQMIVVAARPGLGKALALDTPLPTPSGWTTMAEVAVGDELIAADGPPTRVIATSDVMVGRPCYEVCFADGSVITADAEHEWLTETTASSRIVDAASVDRGHPLTAIVAVRTTAEIAASVRPGAGRRPSHSISLCLPLLLPERLLPIEPYMLGVWLGTGVDDSAAFTRIPIPYLRASERQRRALLAGLMDAAGTVTAAGALRVSVTSRRLALDIQELVFSLGYHCSMTTGTAVPDPATPAQYLLTFTTGDDIFRIDSKRRLHKDRRVAVGHRSFAHVITEVRAVGSVPVRCVEIEHPDHLYLAGRSMIPTHNSTLGLDFARSCSVKHGMTSAIFSLEMSRTEIVMRLLSAEARIRLTDMRSGRMSDDDWTRMARRMSEISEAPLFIDDSPNLTMMEIRAKARRMRQRHGLRLLVVDYLQLMTSGKRVESRQQEVSEFSRQMKLLAKELEVPVVAISQLNRGPEQRTDKRPMLADLRESGCLTARSRLMRADTGAEASLGELIDSGESEVVLWSLDERMRLVPRKMTAVFCSGVKEVFRVRLRSGRELEATASHPLLTVDGWCALGELTPGDRLAVVRRVPSPIQSMSWPEEHVELLARCVADESGSSACGGFQRDHIAGWLDGLGLSGVSGHQRCVPAPVFGLVGDQVALFLRHLWAASGLVIWDATSGFGSIYCTTTSRRLADDVSRLLLRFGILSRLKRASSLGCRDRWRLSIIGPEYQRAFMRFIGVPGVSAEAARVTVGAAVLDDAGMEMLVTNDVFWDEITEITSVGEQPVYDATVPGTHNFVANGIAVHNSIEQDADLVILLHRPDAFERDDPRAGEADLILAKHRNGPTSTITVAHQLHYSRFVDLAR